MRAPIKLTCHWWGQLYISLIFLQNWPLHLILLTNMCQTVCSLCVSACSFFLFMQQFSIYVDLDPDLVINVHGNFQDISRNSFYYKVWYIWFKVSLANTFDQMISFKLATENSWILWHIEYQEITISTDVFVLATPSIASWRPLQHLNYAGVLNWKSNSEKN